MMKNILVLILPMFIISTSCNTAVMNKALITRDQVSSCNLDPFEQTPRDHQLTWQRWFGGLGDDIGYCVQQTSDGGYIVAGSTVSFVTSWTVYLIKIDKRGRQQWSRTFGEMSTGNSLQQTNDGGYILAGEIYFFGRGTDVYLIKTDKDGNEEWSRTFGGKVHEGGESVQQTNDGGFIIAGTTKSFDLGQSDVYLIKTDSNGDEEWNKTFGGVGFENGYSVQQTSDGGFIIAGSTNSFGAGAYDVYLIKTDSNGNEEWNRTFGGKASEFGESVQQTNDGGFIIAGTTRSFGAGLRDIYLIKTDSSGNEEWNKTFGGVGFEDGYSVQQTNDGGFIIAGETCSVGANDIDVYLIKTDRNGSKQWSRTFGGGLLASDAGYCVQQTSDRGYIVVGTTCFPPPRNYDVYLIKTDSRGKSKNYLERDSSLARGVIDSLE
jgi:hypothetical protein